MSWSGWSARLNVTSIVSQGLEQVSKLKEDVEKQFDQAVQGAASKPSAASSSAHASGLGASTPDLFGGSIRRDEGAGAPAQRHSLPPAAPVRTTVDDINVIKPTQWPSDASPASRVGRQLLQQPPYSADGKQRRQLPPATSVPIAFGRHEQQQESSSSNAAEHEDAPVVDESGNGVSLENTATTAEADSGAAPSALEQSEENVDPSQSTALAPDSEADTEGERPSDVSEAPADTVETRQSGEDAALPLDPVADDDTTHRASVDTAESPAPATPTDDVTERDETDDARGDAQVSEPAVVLASESTEASTLRDGTAAASGAAAATSDASLSDDSTSALREQIAALQAHLRAREDQLIATSSTIQELHDELDRTCQREVSAVERARFLTEQLESMRLEVTKLNRMASGQRASDLEAMQAALSEKDAKLEALLEEGQALSIKQAQFEQRVRQLRKEKNEDEEARLKLQAQHDTLAIQLQDATAKRQAADDANKQLTLELRQAQTTAERVTTALATAEQRAAALAAQVTELSAQNDALTQRTSVLEAEVAEAQHTSASHALLSTEKAELTQTIAYLEQTLAALETESTRREELARLEVQDLKRKWQDAMQRVDVLGQSVSDATQPLLRQIHALEDDQRARQETWRATEATLRQRIADATALRRQGEAELLARDEQLHALQQRVEALEQDSVRRAAELAREKETAAAATASARELATQLETAQRERDDWQRACDAATHAKTQLEQRLARERSSTNKTADSAVSTAASELAELRAREAQLQHDLEWHQQELRRLKTSTAAALPPRSGGGTRISTTATGDSSGVETQAAILQQTLTSSLNDDDAFTGATSVLGMSQLQQRLRLREGENRLVKQQLEALERKQSELTDEIVRLSTRNALLETAEAQMAQTTDELRALQQRQHVLLELFGEKEEQVEELQAEVSELKAFYRKQLDTLATHQTQQS